MAIIRSISISCCGPTPYSVHGAKVVENEISGYYLADEISATYRGMLIAISEKNWLVFQRMTPLKFANVLKKLAANMKLSRFRKHPRGPKKPQPKRKGSKKTPHVSTAKILAKRNQ